MKNIIKYVCIVMIVIGGLNLSVEALILFSAGLAGPAQFTFSFISHVLLLIVGIMGLKFRDDPERYKMLAGISGMQTLFCLLAVIVSNTLWITLKMIGIDDILSIACSVILLILYIIVWKKQKDSEI